MKKGLKNIFLLFLVLCPWSFVHGRVSPPTTISNIEIDGDIIVSKKNVVAVLPFKVGDTFDQEKLGEGLGYLKIWGIFDRVEAGATKGADGVSILIHLHQPEVLSQIDISGNYPYIKSQIRKRINLEVGNIVVPAQLEAQKDRIKDFYVRRGFYHTSIDLETEPAAESNSVGVAYHIIKGDRLRYKQVEFEGAKNFKKGRLLRFIRPMSIYSEKRLKDSIKEMIGFLRNNGYLKATVKVIDKKIDWDTRRVAIQLAVKEGPKVDIFFRGKSPYRLKTLKKTITLYQEGHFDSFELQASVDALTQKLNNDGYLEGKVTYKLEKINPNMVRIFFTLNSGIESNIHSINFTGNKSIKTGKLRKQILTKEKSLTQDGFLIPLQLEEDRKIATFYYQTKGYPDVQIKSPDVISNPARSLYSIDFPVDEGPLVTIGSVTFLGNTSFPKEKLVPVLKNKPEEPFDNFQLLSDKDDIQLFYANNGYPYATVEQKTERVEDKINITYTIQEGSLVHIGEILPIGNILTSFKAIRQAMGIKIGDPYSKQKIVEAQLNLRRLGTFNSVGIVPLGLEEKKTTTHLRVKLEERDPFVIDMDAQYSTDLQYSGSFKFTNFNSFGRAKRTSLLLMGGKQKDRAELSWLDPRFAAHDIQMTFSGWMDYEKKPVETTLQTGGAISFFRQFHRFGFLTRYELDRNYPFSGPAANPLSLRNSTFSQIGFSGSYDTRNSFADPTRGFIVTGGGTIFNELGGLESNFAKLKTSFNHLIPLLYRLTLSNTIRLDHIQNIGASAIVPQRTILTLGGDDTVRGFKEDRIGPLDNQGRPLGGRVRLIYNTELRFRIASTLQFAGFFDMGSLTNQFSQIDDNTLRRSAGAGLRYITPAGPIRVDYGIILDRKPGESFGRLHITFGYPF